MFKDKHLNIKIKNAINLIFIFLDKREILIIEFIFIIYNLYKINMNNKKSLKKSLSRISRNIEELLKELINFIIKKNLIN